MEELLARHRKEAKELQSRITSKKKNATKKTRKGVNDECATLEREMKARHEEEITTLGGEKTEEAKAQIAEEENNAPDIEEAVESLSISQRSTDAAAATANNLSASEVSNQAQRKPNRQKARLARRAAERDAVAAEAAEEAKLQPDLRKLEIEAMNAQFKQRGLTERFIQPDGHCLYSAVADQLKQLGVGLHPKTEIAATTVITDGKDYLAVRKAAAEYMKRNKDSFEPFLEEPFDGYVHKVQDTAEWGGQLELMALAKAYRININVLQKDGRVEQIKAAENSEFPTAWVAYYLHSFGLGEHYNSLRKAAS